MFYLLLKMVHIIGAAVLLGTGAGIAFFMLVAHLRGDPREIAGVARTVVLADFLFTASAVVLQPITGTWLAWSSSLEADVLHQSRTHPGRGAARTRSDVREQPVGAAGPHSDTLDPHRGTVLLAEAAEAKTPPA
ncbi:DUF2269 domain-containing protein [Bradyrhizobium sp. 174]|uniref:DUF2269 domain-containing protein n=1 Tax=Bradyrhizobium sp. 174 TaxID=2782645 RepID=UPI001FFB138D|nr:DUF2269 domain-containing protein [Bradyrhizobium sp. 174]MCK1576844.1 DUF2269 domain-containing protein [Bradyrhizobium sp. 174]